MARIEARSERPGTGVTALKAAETESGTSGQEENNNTLRPATEMHGAIIIVISLFVEAGAGIVVVLGKKTQAGIKQDAKTNLLLTSGKASPQR